MSPKKPSLKKDSKKDKLSPEDWCRIEEFLSDDPWSGQSLSVGGANSAVTAPEKIDPFEEQFYSHAPEYSFWLALTVCKLFWHTWWDAPAGKMCFWCCKRAAKKGE